MSVKKTAQGAKYKDLITKTDSDVQAEQVDVNVQMAQNSLQQGILSTKSLVLSAQGKVKEAEVKLAQAKRNQESAKSSVPLNVQKLIDTFQATKQAELDVETATEAFKSTQEVLVHLQSVETELF